MESTPINELIDQLLARDGEYRPLSLLVLLRRLDRSSLSKLESESDTVLEDEIYGDLARVLEQLDRAAQRARALGLEPQTEPRQGGQGQVFRRATADHQARTVWRRAPASAQADLFLDNGLAVARRELCHALIQADRPGAEAALLSLSRIASAPDLLADGEHLVDALAWLEADRLDADSALDALDGDLAVRARRLLGRGEGERFIARLLRDLAHRAPIDEAGSSTSAPATSSPSTSRAELFERAGDHEEALAAIDQVKPEDRNTHLQLVDLRASLALEERDRALKALSRLCWSDPAAAEAWLETGDDEELSRRIEQFWDLEEALDLCLFPAWLLAHGYPVPAVDNAPDHDAARALERVRSLRQAPSDIQARRWLQTHFPDLMADWMKERA